MISVITILLSLCSLSTEAQDRVSLQQQIEEIILTKNAAVGVSIIGNEGKDTILVNGDKHFPMQSVFKFHIGIAVLSQIDEGKFSLDQNIELLPRDLLPNLYSP